MTVPPPPGRPGRAACGAALTVAAAARRVGPTGCCRTAARTAARWKAAAGRPKRSGPTQEAAHQVGSRGVSHGVRHYDAMSMGMLLEAVHAYVTRHAAQGSGISLAWLHGCACSWSSAPGRLPPPLSALEADIYSSGVQRWCTGRHLHPPPPYEARPGLRVRGRSPSTQAQGAAGARHTHPPANTRGKATNGARE